MSLQSAAHDVLQDEPALQRPLTEMRTQHAPEQPLRRAQARFVAERESRNAIRSRPGYSSASDSAMLGAAEPLLELVDVA